jgi:hypothetical protein
MKIKSTKWFKDYNLYTSAWAVIKFWGGLGLAAFGIKNAYEAGGLNVLNRLVDAQKEDEVEDNFDEMYKFNESK